MPTLTAAYYVPSTGDNALALVTPSFTPVNGEVLVVKMGTWDRAVAMNLPTGGGQTYTSRVAFGPTGFQPWVGIATAAVSGSPGSMTVSASPAASCRHWMVVERWSSAQVASSPAVTTANNTGASVPSSALDTTASNSAVSWVIVDSQSINPATRAYLSSAAEEGLWDGSGSADAVAYFAYQSATATGSQAVGLSAPGGQKWALAAIEVQDALSGDTARPRRQTVYPPFAVMRAVW